MARREVGIGKLLIIDYMRIYLDSNIIIAIENGYYTLKDVLRNIDVEDDGKIEILYSMSHIYEAENILGDTETVRNERINQRLKTIQELTKNKYIYRKLPNNEVIIVDETPFNMYETITGVMDTRPIFNSMMSVVSEEQKAEFRKSLGIDIREINNYTSENVVAHLNTKVASMGMTLVEMVEYGVNLHPDGKSFSLHNRFAGIFELLDMLGYWTDKPTPKSNVARLWDANHAYFASFCDYFISNDKRTRNKAKVVYSIYDVSTNVLSSDGKD